MQRFAGWIALHLVVCALLIGGARWIGHWAAPDVVPLPTSDGCWLDVCPFRLPLGAFTDALDAAPGVVPGSAQFIPDEYATGADQVVAYRYAPDHAAPQSLVLLPGTDRYVIERDWRSAAAMMRLGDLVAAFGPPERVRLSPPDVLLDYDARHLSVAIYPRATAYYDWVRLTPRDFVVRFSVTNPDHAAGSDVVYYPPSRRWQGFSLYRFGD